VISGVIPPFSRFTPEVTLLERGTIAKEFETNVKAPRFVDKRG